MKRLTLLLLLALCYVGAGPILVNPYVFAVTPTIHFVQQKTASTNGSTTLSVTFDTPVTVGNGVVAIVTTKGGTILSIDNGLHTFLAQRVTKAGSGVTTEIWSLDSVDLDGLDTFTVTLVSSVEMVITITEWSAASYTGSAVTTGDASDTSTTVAPSSSTPASTMNIIFAAGAWDNANANYSSGPTNGFTRLTAVSSTHIEQEAAYKIQTSATANSPAWTINSSTDWAAVSAAFDW